jgi:CHAT domain-containing protein
LLAGLCLLAACHCSERQDPAAALQSIQGDFLHGNLDLARERAAKARHDFSGASAADLNWAMKFRLLEADILTYQGRHAEVIALLAAGGVSYPVTGDAAIKRDLLLGLAHSVAGQSQRSAIELSEARGLAETAKSPLLGEVFRTEAVVQLYRNHFPDAMALFRRSLEFAREHDDAYLEATDLLNIGYLTSQMERYDEAIVLLNEAAKFAQPIHALTVIEAALGNIGEAYLHLGDFEKALVNYREAEHQAEQIGTTSAQIDWLQAVGLSYYKLGDLDRARSYDERALAAARTQHAYADIATIESNLAFLLLRQEQYASAATHSEAAVRAAHQSTNASAADLPRFLQAVLALRQGRPGEAERLLIAVHTEAVNDTGLRWDIENTLANVYAAGHRSAQAESWYRRSIDTFESQRALVRNEALKLSFFANGDTLYQDYAGFLIDTRRPKQALQLLDHARARTLEEGLGLNEAQAHPAPQEAPDAESVARKVGGTLLFYSLGREKSYLWAVGADSTRLFVLPRRADIESLVERYQRAILKSSDPLRDVNPQAASLYDILIAPAASMIPKDSSVFLIRDGILNGLNFETLLMPGAAGPRYWIEEATVANASSIRLLSNRNTRPWREKTKTLLLIGNAVAAGGDYDNLPNAGAEVDGVRKHFARGDSTVVTRAQALPSAYPANRPDGFSYIHFVAHATANRLNPLDSAVVLSAPPDNPDRFKLYARDILRYPIHARLVTVSACYGSGIRTYPGEGPVGLAWAFLRAGSHDVIGALWEANDASTPLLMDRLYEEIAQGKTPDAALRGAKLSLIHSSSVYRKPLYWGAFELYTGA